MKYMKKNIFRNALVSASLGILSTFLFWLSITTFSEFFTIITFIIMSTLTVVFLQNRHWGSLFVNISAYIVSIIFSFMIENKIDFFHWIFSVTNPGIEMNAGTGFGMVVMSPIYIVLNILSLLIATIISYIRNIKKQ